MPVPTEAQHKSHRPTHTLHHIATHDLHHGSPTTPSKFEIERPRRRSLSPIPASPLAAEASSSKSVYVPPPPTWHNAAQDAMAGIYYTKDAFPSSSFLPPPFSREPVTVEAGERIELLEEYDDYAVRVRVLRTDVVGLIPAWNTEGALERLTRVNTAFNEAVRTFLAYHHPNDTDMPALMLGNLSRGGSRVPPLWQRILARNQLG